MSWAARADVPPRPWATPGFAPIEGYASLFGVVDLSNDLVEPGAFARSLRRRGTGGIRMLFQHDPAEPIGVWNEVLEDARGLFAKGTLNLSVRRAQEIAALLAQGAIDGLSIGFKTVRARRDAGVRRLAEIDLWEISVVTFPMLPTARVEPAPFQSPVEPKARGRGANLLAERGKRTGFCPGLGPLPARLPRSPGTTVFTRP